MQHDLLLTKYTTMSIFALLTVDTTRREQNMPLRLFFYKGREGVGGISIFINVKGRLVAKQKWSTIGAVAQTLQSVSQCFYTSANSTFGPVGIVSIQLPYNLTLCIIDLYLTNKRQIPPFLAKNAELARLEF